MSRFTLLCRRAAAAVCLLLLAGLLPLGALLAAPLAATGTRADLPPLVDAGWLLREAGAADLKVLDIQDERDFRAHHIPGAVNVPFARWRTEAPRRGQRGAAIPALLPPTAALEAMIGAAGIDQDTRVVIVATGRGAGDLAAAARVLWTFVVLGHDAVALLDGGLVAYAEAGGRIASGAPGAVQPARFTARPRPEMVPDAAAVQAAFAAGVAMVDARSDGEYFGVYRGGPGERPGTIPGARHLPYEWLSQDGSGQLRTPGALRELFAARRIATEGKQVHFCHSGNRAALTWFAAYALFGNRDALLYDASMLEWARRADLPIERRIDLCEAC